MEITIDNKPDAETIERLNESVHREHQERRPDWFKPYALGPALEGTKQLLSKPGVRALVVHVDGEPAAYATLIEQERPATAYRFAYRSLEIDQMAVHPDFRRRGIATTLMDEIKRIARSGNFDHLRLTVWSDNASAKAFYESAGFSTFRETMEMTL